MKNRIKDFVAHRTPILTVRSSRAATLRGLIVFCLLTLAVPAAWSQGLPAKTCPGSGGGTVQAYLCPDDIVVVDGSGANTIGTKVGGLYLVDPVSGNQTPISTGNNLGQASSVTIEPGTGKLLVAGRQWGVIRIDPKDGSQEVLLKGGNGWAGGYPTFLDSSSNTNKSFVYPAAITIDPRDSSILITDTGIHLNSCSDPNNVSTCLSDPGKIIRLVKAGGSLPGVYTGTYSVVAEGGLLSDPFDIVADGSSNLYVSDMNAKLGGVVNGYADPGQGGIIYLNPSTDPITNKVTYQQSTFFASWSQTQSTTLFGIATLGSFTPGSGYTNGTYRDVSLTGGIGTGATADITVTNGG